LGSEDSRKISWIIWDTICPKEDESLGVRRIRVFNVSLFGKWCWRLRGKNVAYGIKPLRGMMKKEEILVMWGD